MLASLGNAIFLNFGLIVSGWTLPVLVLLVVVVAALVIFKFRGKEHTDGRVVPVEEPAESPAREQVSPKPAARAETMRPAAREAPKHREEPHEINDLPIGQMTEVLIPGPLEPLSPSNDEGLLAAIDELQDDSDADAEFRAVALRVLAGFKSRNSIEALSQIALYDLSTNLRAKAVGMLADFDHQSVFETIILSCADPSREVRAAGARALVKVTFDRGDEWARFAISDDKYLKQLVARAAVEAGLVERLFDRLTLKDEKSVYEAFALVFLLVKAGETEKIFQAIREHRDTKIRLALLHILKVANVAEMIPHLTALIAAEPMASAVADKAREALLGITAMPVEA